jgi:hypothetical protein
MALTSIKVTAKVHLMKKHQKCLSAHRWLTKHQNCTYAHWWPTKTKEIKKRKISKIQLFIRSFSAVFWVRPTLNSSQEHWNIRQSEDYAIWFKRWPLNHIHGIMNSQFLEISLLSMIATWRLYKLVPIDMSTNSTRREQDDSRQPRHGSDRQR